MLGLRDSAENTVLSIDRYNANTITFVYGTLKVETLFNRSLPIGPSLVKLIFPVICYPLTHIYNLSLCSGQVPKKLIIAKVIPVYKKGMLRWHVITDLFPF